VAVSPVNYWKTGAQMANNGGWSRAFDDPIPLPRGRGGDLQTACLLQSQLSLVRASSAK